MSRPCFHRSLAGVLLALVVLTAAASRAAEPKIVLFEKFGATW